MLIPLQFTHEHWCNLRVSHDVRFTVSMYNKTACRQYLYFH